MTLTRSRIRLYLALSSLFAGASAVYLLARGSRLPYGGVVAPWAAGTLFAGAVAAALASVRLGRLRTLLTSSPPFEVPVEKLPSAPDQTYLGRGFSWGPEHAERLTGLLASERELAGRARDGWGGNRLIHGVGAGRARDLFIPDPLLTQHLLALGATGTGKTRLLELLALQAVRRGDAVVVIDPKGDERLLDRTYDAAVRSGRGGDFRFFAPPYPFESARYNPLASYVRVNEITDRIALVLPRGSGDAEAFRNFAWDFVNRVATALDLLKEPITLSALENYCLHNTWLLVRKLVKHFCPGVDAGGDLKAVMSAYRAWTTREGRGVPELDRLVKMASMDAPYFEKLSSALKPIFAKLLSPTVGYLLCPGEVAPPGEMLERGPAPELSWKLIDEERLVVYFFLGSMLGPETASGIARMCLADLQGYLGRKYAYEAAGSGGRMSVLIDEVGDVLAPESAHLLNKARGAGLSLTLAGQSLADLEVALRSEADARRALANIATSISFRAESPQDAEYFSAKCGDRPMRVSGEVETYEPALFSSGHRAIDDFTLRASRSVTVRDQALVAPYLLGELPTFHFFAHHSGSVEKAVLPFLDPPRERYSTRLKGVDPA